MTDREMKRAITRVLILLRSKPDTVSKWMAVIDGLRCVFLAATKRLQEV